MARPQSRTGLMVIRIWIDNGTGADVRARITRSVDLKAEDTSITYARSIEEVTAAVQAWLEAFLATAGAPPPHNADGRSPP